MLKELSSWERCMATRWGFRALQHAYEGLAHSACTVLAARQGCLCHLDLDMQQVDCTVPELHAAVKEGSNPWNASLKLLTTPQWSSPDRAACCALQGLRALQYA